MRRRTNKTKIMANPRRCPICKSVEDVSGPLHHCSSCHTIIEPKIMKACPSIVNASSTDVTKEQVRTLKKLCDNPQAFWELLDVAMKMPR